MPPTHPLWLNPFQLSLIPAVPPMRSFGVDLDTRLSNALDFFRRTYPQFPFNPEDGVLRQLNQLADDEPQPDRKRAIIRACQSLRGYFKISDTEHPETNNGQIRFFVSPDNLCAFLVATPPRENGDMPTVNVVTGLLAQANIVHGIDLQAIERALATMREYQDIVWCAAIAQGRAPRAARFGSIAFQVPTLDKEVIRHDLKALSNQLLAVDSPVNKGTRIGTLTRVTEAREGVTVYGAPLPPPPAEIALDIGDDIEQGAGGALTARSPGLVIVDGLHVDVVPFYIIRNPTSAQVQHVTFPGAILVHGHLVGPGHLECEDLFVLGNCEQVNVISQHDVFVLHGIIGHHQTRIETDGGVYAAFISESDISALGSVMVDNAIINSQVISNRDIHVTSPKGMIAGGKVYALKNIITATIGSEFGMLTETAVGKDFLTTGRTQDIARKIAVHIENLRRIQELKQQLERLKVPIERMPVDKQEIYIGVLRKEQTSQAEMNSLLRRKKILGQALTDFIAASIQVLDNLYPPVNVQIGDVIQEIRQKLTTVTLSFDHQLGIVSTSSVNKGESAP